MELEREAAEGMGSRMETFEQIRRDRDREGLSIRALAERYGVHRRAVRQALASPLPPVKRAPVGRPAPKLGGYQELIDSWLEGDRDAPRKQRHTARRIWERLRDEHAADVAERTVREYVHRRRRERGEGVEAFVPQVREAGVEGEVDWGEAQVWMAACATKVYLFHMRACHSGAAFAMAFPHCSQQAFLEAHVHAFDWFGGVFGLVRYDNLASAVKQVLRGRQRVQTDRFIALRSHYMYESQFTIPGVEGAHEKGGIEGEVGRFRRRHLVPVPEVSTLGELNARLLAGCETDLHRRISGRPETVGESFARERPLLRGLPVEKASTAEEATPRVNTKALVTIKQNSYSVPVRLAGLRVHSRVGERDGRPRDMSPYDRFMDAQKRAVAAAGQLEQLVKDLLEIRDADGQSLIDKHKLDRAVMGELPTRINDVRDLVLLSLAADQSGDDSDDHDPRICTPSRKPFSAAIPITRSTKHSPNFLPDQCVRPRS